MFKHTQPMSFRAQEASEVLFAAILDLTRDAIIGIDHNHNIILFNQGAKQAFGYSASEVIGRPFEALLAFAENQAIHIQEFMESATEIWMRGEWREVLGQHKNGIVFPAEVNVAKMVHGGQTLFAATFRDLTERKQAETRIERQLQRLAALRVIDTAIIGSFDLQVTLNVVLDQALTQLEVDAAAILLFDPSTQTLTYAAGRGFRTPAIEYSQVRLEDGLTGMAVRGLHIVHTSRLAFASHFTRGGLLAQEQFVEYYAAPMLAKGQTVGVLEVFYRTPHPTDEEWRTFLEILAGQAAIAVDNAQLFENLQRSNADLVQAYDATIEGWSRAMDLRDKETEGHTLRVTAMTERLARALNMAETELVHVRRGALLHDIGKMGVPDGILLKTGALTEGEWTLMRQHPQLAYNMLAPIAYLKPALDIPYCHHEKWDGTGYPRRLHGEQIPLAARLFAVVDVWDALRFDRPYRAGWPEAQVLEHLRSLSGTHFDPQAVELFFHVIG